MRAALLISVTLLVSACGGPTTPTPNHDGPAPLASSIGPAPSASAAPDAAPAEPTANVGELSYVVTGDQSFELFALEDAVVAIMQERMEPSVRRIDDTTITDATGMLAPIEIDPPPPGAPPGRLFKLRTLSGSTTGDLDAVFETAGGKMNTTRETHRRNGKWKNGHALSEAETLPLPTSAVLPDHRILMVDYDDRTKITLLEIDPSHPRPAGWMPVATKTGAPAGCATTMASYDRIGVIGDRLYGIGSVCAGKDAKGGNGIETWTIGKAGSSVAPLPGAPSLDPDRVGLEMVAGALHLVGAAEGKPPYVARFDGKAWTEMSPERGAGAGEFVDVRGKLHLFFDDVGFRREGDAWKAITFPKRVDGEGPYRRFRAVKDGSIWALLDGRLYRLDPDRTVLERVALPAPPSGAGSTPLVVDDIAFTPGGAAVVAVTHGEAHFLVLQKKH